MLFALTLGRSDIISLVPLSSPAAVVRVRRNYTLRESASLAIPKRGRLHQASNGSGQPLLRWTSMYYSGLQLSQSNTSPGPLSYLFSFCYIRVTAAAHSRLEALYALNGCAKRAPPCLTAPFISREISRNSTYAVRPLPHGDLAPRRTSPRHACSICNSRQFRKKAMKPRLSEHSLSESTPLSK